MQKVTFNIEKHVGNKTIVLENISYLAVNIDFDPLFNALPQPVPPEESYLYYLEINNHFLKLPTRYGSVDFEIREPKVIIPDGNFFVPYFELETKFKFFPLSTVVTEPILATLENAFETLPYYVIFKKREDE